jgi:hypothetical protein
MKNYLFLNGMEQLKVVNMVIMYKKEIVKIVLEKLLSQ